MKTGIPLPEMGAAILAFPSAPAAPGAIPEHEELVIPPPPTTMRCTYPPKTELLESGFGDEPLDQERMTLELGNDDESPWSRLEGEDDEALDEDELLRMTDGSWSSSGFVGRNARRLLQRLRRSA